MILLGVEENLTSVCRVTTKNGELEIMKGRSWDGILGWDPKYLNPSSSQILMNDFQIFVMIWVVKLFRMYPNDKLWL
jgi:hypothetical protein